MEKVPEFLAHVDPHTGRAQTLEEHLRNVANLAAKFAEAFTSSQWSYLTGLWHDLGKYQEEFQRRLSGEAVSVEHSGIGAALAFDIFKADGLPLAFAIAAHHTGLANWIISEPNQPISLKERLKQNQSALKALLASNVIPHELLSQRLLPLPSFLSINSATGDNSKSQRRSSEFWIRFLFSALVDADRLDSELSSTPEKVRLRSSFDTIAYLSRNLDAYLSKKMALVPLEFRDSKVNRVRRMVLEACQRAANHEPGIFGLTVPTGGGKTLSAMNFALRHAQVHNLYRVFVVIPYTSIIEQNAREYKLALGERNVIEHHSNFDLEKLSTADVTRWQLATENWDAPVIVTTSVEFMETLFSSHPSRCRKLHNIARSVIILDEVQLLPPGLLISILEALQELTRHYGCSVVLSTATPPAIAIRPTLPQGLSNIIPIIPNPEALVQQLKRVSYYWPQESSPVEWLHLAEELAQHRQVLTIVHRRNDARILGQELAKLCPPDTVFHLSALMCPAHRLAVIATIVKRLRDDLPCHVVSTQLVEAGVDLDFPIVYRAICGLDSIVQAAGRCNREGRLDTGKVVLFRSPTSPPPGTLRKALQTTESMLSNGLFEPDEPETIERYFRMLYQKENLDALNIQREREEFNFATVGRDFHLIEDGFTQSVIVRWGIAPKLLDELNHDGPSRETFRRLQPYTVNIYPDGFQKLSDEGVLVEIAPALYTIALGFERYYSETYGLTAGDETEAMPPLVI